MSKQVRGHSTQLVVRALNTPLLPAVAQLAGACFKNQVSVVSVAAQLGVTRATVYNWFTGKSDPRPRYLPLIEQLARRLSK